MSDRIHFGALRLQDRDRMIANRNTGSSGNATGAFSESAQRSIEQRQAVLQQFEQNRMARNIVVPTNDDHVKLKLREMGQVICYFGEGRMNRACFYLEFSY